MLRFLLSSSMAATSVAARSWARAAVPDAVRGAGRAARAQGQACPSALASQLSRQQVYKTMPQQRGSTSAARAAAQPDASPAPIQARIAMVGAGNMGGAMLKGWMRAGILSPEQSAACTRNSDKASAWQQRGLEVFGDALDDAEAAQICEFSDIIFLGVKPQFLRPVLAALAPHVTPKHTLVSIAAGWTLAQLEAALPPGTAVMRVMPNTPILVGQGASVYCLGSHAGDADRRVVHELLQACGVAMEVGEDNIDAVVGVSGSGPAYMFQVLEAMADGGVRAGLPRQQALLLAAQTMKGAAEMVLSGSDPEGASGGAAAAELLHPGMLKDQVTSPGGTTITAVAVLEERGVRAAFINAVGAAAQKSRSMAAAQEEAAEGEAK
eukprot:jgi/Ulvmu1/10646/UM066_0026.1